MEPITLLYLDPATGSLTFQVLIGGLLAFLALMRRFSVRAAFWRRFRRRSG